MKRRFPLLFEFLFVECQKKGYTQKRVADLLGLDSSTISRMKKGQSQVVLANFFKICEICHLSPTDMLRKWQKTEEYTVIDKRKETYLTIIEDALRLDLGMEIDCLLESFRVRVDKEKDRRRREASIRRIKRDLHPRKRGGLVKK